MRTQDSRQIQRWSQNRKARLIGIHDGVCLRPPCVKESRAINYACPASHVVQVRPINNQWRRKVRGLSALHRRSLQRLSITKINLPRNLHSGKSDPTHPSLLGIGKFNDFVRLVPRAHEFSACLWRTFLRVYLSLHHYYINFLCINKNIL